MYYQPFFIEMYAQCEADERLREAAGRRRGDSDIVVRLIGVVARTIRRLSTAAERWASGTGVDTTPAQYRARAH